MFNNPIINDKFPFTKSNSFKANILLSKNKNELLKYFVNCKEF